MGGGGAHILGSPMLFVPFTVPTFPATHHQTSHPAHQSHHQQLQANTQNPVQQPQQLTQLNQLSHLNHQGIVPATTNQPTIHSTSCSPQQQATTPNKVKDPLDMFDYAATCKCKFRKYRNFPQLGKNISRMDTVTWQI